MALRMAAKRAAVVGVAGTALTTTAASTALYVHMRNNAATGGKENTTTTTSSSSLAGLGREVQFWRKVGPIVLDYYLQTASSSPLVRFQKWQRQRRIKSARKEHNDETSDNNDEAEAEKRQRQAVLAQLHQRHAPEMLQILLDLKGLYIKLGQVLSVTALPIPDLYREQFRTLQSDVPVWEPFDSVVQPVIETELGIQSIHEVFEYVDPIPCGAASIGQAHRARLKPNILLNDKNDDDNDKQDDEKQVKNQKDVIIKVQYPDAAWQVPADIQCVGDFLQVCVWAGVVDESSARLSFEEFARQFLAELDYQRECSNLQAVYQSSLDPTAPYQRRNVVIPAVYRKLCTDKIITMTYLPGPKLEAEARRQLESLGLGGSATGGANNLRTIVQEAAKDAADPTQPESGELVRRITKGIHRDENDDDDDLNGHEKLSQTRRRGAARRSSGSSRSTSGSPFAYWTMTASRVVGQMVGIDSILWTVRMARRIVLWTQAVAVTTLQATPPAWVPISWQDWADGHRTAAAQAARLSLTKDWMDALFDVHGHQIFQLGLFHADPHPGNILVVEEEEEEGNDSQQPLFSSSTTTPTKLGLIDFGQCKRLTPREQVQVAQLILSVANEESDLSIATAYRNLNIKTKNDSTAFLAEFGRLMFGPFRPEHLSHDWHRNLHQLDRVLYFPNELSMVYRTALLLRGLAVSLQLNYSVGHEWKTHAQATIDRYPDIVQDLLEQEQEQTSTRLKALAEDRP